MIRLLNIHTLEFKEYFGNDLPRYVIASHRWLEPDKEAKYQDIVDRSHADTLGLRKVRQFCDFIRSLPGSDSFHWLWIDTICIDKTNSVELSEAINSMFRWYRKAYFCLAYLHDVSTGNIGKETSVVHHALQDSDWFQRGWTLQELLAPDVVVFLDKNWHIIGHKNSHKQKRLPETFPYGPPLNQHLSIVTGISQEVLGNYSSSDDFSFKKKKSWLGRRATTRKEDHAYCMLGILGVSMSPLYGEGRHYAWQRLEESARRYELLPTDGKTESEVSHYCCGVDCCSKRPTLDASHDSGLVPPLQSPKNADFEARSDNLQGAMPSESSASKDGRVRNTMLHRHSEYGHSSTGDLRASINAPAQDSRRSLRRHLEKDAEIESLNTMIARSAEERASLADQLKDQQAIATRSEADARGNSVELDKVKAELNEDRTRLRALQQENARTSALKDSLAAELEYVRLELKEERARYRVLEQNNEHAWMLKNSEQQKRKEAEQGVAKAISALTESNEWLKASEQERKIVTDDLKRERAKNQELELERCEARKSFDNIQATLQAERDQGERLRVEATIAAKLIEEERAKCEKLEHDSNEPSPDLLKAPIRFKDAVGRTFIFPWHVCKTWKGMEILIKEAFRHVDMIGEHVQEGNYDLTGPEGEIILPQTWESMVQPNWEMTMHLWPMEEEKKPPQDDFLSDPFASLGSGLQPHSLDLTKIMQKLPAVHFNVCKLCCDKPAPWHRFYSGSTTNKPEPGKHFDVWKSECKLCTETFVKWVTKRLKDQRPRKTT